MLVILLIKYKNKHSASACVVFQEFWEMLVYSPVCIQYCKKEIQQRLRELYIPDAMQAVQCQVATKIELIINLSQF